MLKSVVAYSSEELLKRMLQEVSIVLGDGCHVRVTVMRPDNVIDNFRMFYSNSKEFCKYVVLKVFFHCYSNSLLEIVVSTFYVTTQKHCCSDDMVKLAYLRSNKRIIDITNETSMTNYLWCCRPEHRHRNVATI